MSSATAAIGTLLQREDGAGSFQTVAEVLSISGPTLSASQIDVTNHSTTGNYSETIAGLLDGGEVTFDINYLPGDASHKNAVSGAGFNGLLYDYSNRVNGSWKLVFTDSFSTEWTFNGPVTGFEVSAPTDAQLTASVTIKVNGAPTLA